MQQTLKDFYNRTTSKRNAPDTILIGTVLLMSLLGLVMTYTTTFAWAYLENGTPFFYFLSQLRAMAFGAVAFVVFIFIDYSLLRKLAVPILIVIV
ncbi:MAG: FtsW/RodA/SpoVE family cell cycle protein, partial [Chloroflexi bacterium]|nr:FtsW/RodA/SpoVE family cell cycle protein [Chloroflexota bacterium]